jgi:hypothetical protein
VPNSWPLRGCECSPLHGKAACHDFALLFPRALQSTTSLPHLTPTSPPPTRLGYEAHAPAAAAGPPPALPPLPLLELDDDLFDGRGAVPYVSHQALGASYRDAPPGAAGFIDNTQLAAAYRRVGVRQEAWLRGKRGLV